MSDSQVFEIEGMGELLRAIDEMPERFLPIAEKAMQRSIGVIEGRLADYPPETAANRPGRMTKRGGPMGYYERGQGWQRPIRGLDGITVYKNLKNSQRLRNHWYHAVTKTENGIEGVIGNAVTYMPYVNGMKQARNMAEKGWPRIDAILEASSDDIDAAWDEALDELAAEWSKDD